MNQYYYTVASLPAIRFDEPPFLDADAFLEACRAEVSPEDMAVIAGARILPPPPEPDAAGTLPASPGTDVDRESPDLLSSYYRIVGEFQRFAAQIRARNLGWDAERLPMPEGLDPAMGDRARAILNESNPLRAETALMRWLWQVVEALETGHPFDREALVAYHLKLLIAARRVATQDAARGTRNFDDQYREAARPENER